MLGWFPFHCFQLLPASTASRAASEGWWRKRALAASLVQLGRSSFLAAVNQTRRRCGLMVIGGKTREEERLPCHRGWGRLWRPWRLLQCSGGSIQGVVNVFREPLWRTDDVWRLLFRLPSQAKLPRRRKLGAFPTNYGTPRKAFKLSFLCHAIEAAFYPLLLLHIYWSFCASVELHAMLCSMAMLRYIP